MRRINISTMARTLVAAALGATLCLGGCGGGATSDVAADGTTASVQAAVGGDAGSAPVSGADLQFLEDDDLVASFSKLDGVKEAKKIDGSFQYFTAKYLLTFEQPLDWKDPSAGTFDQRVTVGVVATPMAYVLSAEGYLIDDEGFTTDSASDLTRTIQATQVSVEHRFFGASCPEGLSYDDVEHWQYFTAENSAADLHKVYQELSKVFKGTWAATGVSYGGQLCDAYAYYYPKDMSFYVPYVAPLSSGPTDGRVYEWVNTEIGDAKYGYEQAAAYRQLVTDFQVACMARKPEMASQLRPAAEALATAAGKVPPTYRPQVTDDKLFDLVVAEFAVQTWQYGQDFDAISEVLALPDDTAEEQQAKSQATLELLVSTSNPADFSSNIPLWPFYVNTVTEFGQYRYDFSYLRDACEDAGLVNAVSITEDEEETIVYDLVFTPEQQAAFTYRDKLSKALNSWVDTTESNVIMIYGASDPWYAQRLHDTDNPNVHVFVDQENPHTARISSLDSADQAELLALLRSYLGVGNLEDHA